MEKHKVAGIVAGVAAILLLVGGVFTKAWFGKSAEGRSMGVGLWGSVKECRGSECRTASLKMSDFKKGKDKIWLVTGKLGFITAILSALALLGLAATSFTKNPNAAKVALGALGVSAAAALFMLLFTVLKPSDGPSIGVSYSMFMALPGAIAGVVAGVLAKKAAEGG